MGIELQSCSCICLIQYVIQMYHWIFASISCMGALLFATKPVKPVCVVPSVCLRGSYFKYQCLMCCCAACCFVFQKGKKDPHAQKCSLSKHESNLTSTRENLNCRHCVLCRKALKASLCLNTRLILKQQNESTAARASHISLHQRKDS